MHSDPDQIDPNDRPRYPLTPEARSEIEANFFALFRMKARMTASGNTDIADWTWLRGKFEEQGAVNAAGSCQRIIDSLRPH